MRRLGLPQPLLWDVSLHDPPDSKVPYREHRDVILETLWTRSGLEADYVVVTEENGREVFRAALTKVHSSKWRYYFEIEVYKKSLRREVRQRMEIRPSLKHLASELLSA